MLEQFAFYLRHSFNDLKVNRQRTLFAILCIAAGVAAIVSLQTLAVMIGNTLTGNLQENNRGDIQIIPGMAFITNLDQLSQGVEDGVLVEESIRFMGQEENQYYIHKGSIETFEAWARENYPGSVEITYRQVISNELDILIGGGVGTSISDPETGTVVNQLTPAIIDAQVYPFYSELTTRDGTPLRDVLRQPTDIVLSQKAAADLDVSIGQTVTVRGADEPFTVTGIVDTSAEVKNPSTDIFLALFGYYYLDVSALPLFPDANQDHVSAIFFKLGDPTPERVNNFTADMAEQFPYLEITSTEALRENYEQLSDTINQLVTIMGLVSLLIGSIGIINTMQVIVRRRTVEVAVLKTIGLQANQVTILFLVEAFIMGVIGSLVGIVLGWATTFIIRGAAEAVLATDLTFVIAPGPAISGFVVGVTVTAVFGFLPTLTAGQVRPGLVLRPTDDIIPRAGRMRTLLALIVMILALTVIAQTILGSFTTALLVIVGAFLAVGWLYLLLNLLVWLVGRFFPSLGIVDFKISLRQMLAGRSRAAITLLALVIGVFSLSLITLFANSISGMLKFALDESAGGNIVVSVQNYNQVAAVENVLADHQGVENYITLLSYNVTFEGVREDGRVVPVGELADRIDDTATNMAFGGGGGMIDNEQLLASIMGVIDAADLDNPRERTFKEGRALGPEDEGQRNVVITENFTVDGAGIEVGSELVYTLEGRDEPLIFTVVGIEGRGIVTSGFDNELHAPESAFPESIRPNNINVVVRIDDEFVPELRRSMAAIQGTFVLEISVLTDLINSLLNTFTAFPTMVAALGLIVGGVVIANSVALTTMERRREIAVMKAVGLQRERVLGMILLENGILGLIGGLIGVGIGLITLIILIAMLSAPGSTIPFGTALLLMGLCILVALIAAMTTAWSASGEKPLNVLRYE